MAVAFAVTYSFTGSLAVGGLAAVVEPICNVTLMPLHDKLWARHRKTRSQDEESAKLKVDSFSRAAVAS